LALPTLASPAQKRFLGALALRVALQKLLLCAKNLTKSSDFRSKTVTKIIFELAKPALAKPIKHGQNLNDDDIPREARTVLSSPPLLLLLLLYYYYYHHYHCRHHYRHIIIIIIIILTNTPVYRRITSSCY
jgi:hypothetical protein